MKDFINGQMTDEVKAATSTQIFSINQTDKGQGHIIIDYPRLLNHGLGELVAQMQQHCQQQPENHFIRQRCYCWKPRRNIFCVTPNWRKRWRQAALMASVAKNC